MSDRLAAADQPDAAPLPADDRAAAAPPQGSDAVPGGIELEPPPVAAPDPAPEPVVPNWIVEELKALSAIDPEIYPSPAFLEGYIRWQAPVLPVPGRAYFDAVEALPSFAYDMAFVVPTAGGSEARLARRYAACLRERGRHSLIVVTDTEDGVGSAVVREEGIDLLPLGQVMREAWPLDRRQILATLLVNMDLGAVHLIGSELGWDVLCTHGRALRTRCRIYANLAWPGFDEHGLPLGPVRSHLPQAYRFIERVIVPGRALPRWAQMQYGFAPDLFAVVPEWTAPASSRWRFEPGLPQVLCLAAAPPEDATAALHRLQACLPDARLVPAWTGEVQAEAMPFGACVVLGLPVAGDEPLQEAIGAGLPLVAECGGMLDDLLLPELAWGSSAGAGERALASVLDQALRAPAQATARAARLQRALSPAALVAALERVPGYLTPA
jgi:hypothetical protein